jgi:rhodanese-related sulfurtransferase
MADDGYAGDVSPSEAWDILTSESDATLVDVRTKAEWTFVGIPDLSSLGKQVATVEWQQFPAMDVNPQFTDAVSDVCESKEAPILFLCRSGQRSRSAAIAMTALGYSRCYNVSEGFEGDKDGERHRGKVGGWKVAGLPWAQN